MSQGPESLDINIFDSGRYYDSIEGAVSMDENVPDAMAWTDVRSTEGATKEDAEDFYEAGLIYNFKKDFAHAISCLEKAYRIYIDKRLFLSATLCLTELAWLKFSHDRTDGPHKAKRHFAEVSRLINSHIQEPGMNEIRARALHYQGLIKYREKQYGEAVKLMMNAKLFCTPDSLEWAKIQDSLAVHYERTNDYNRAIQCVRTALVIKQRLGISYEEAVSHQILGGIYILKEEYAKAEATLLAAMTVSEELGDFKRIARIKNDLVRIRILQNDTEGLDRLIDDVVDECQRHDLRIPFAMAHFYKGYLAYAQGDFMQARSLLERDILPIFRRFSYKKGYGMASRLLACVEHHDGNDSVAIETMSEVISIFKDEGHVDELAKTYFELGKLYLDLDEDKLALASMLEALKIAEDNGLEFMTSYIEDEIFRLDEQKWQEIIEKRARHERVFEKKQDLSDTLTSLGQNSFPEDDEGSLTPTQSLISLLKIGQAMSAERNLDKLLQLIKSETEQALQADRCTVFLYDRDANELWSKVASGLEEEAQEIRFPAHLGLAGYVAKTGEILNIKNAYEDPRFNQEIDKKTGYKTENILCMPMRNRQMEIIGVFQVLNKRKSHFDKVDEDLLSAITTSAGVAIENTTLAQEMKISFESFVKTLSTTIDARDPITAGHSERVAEYSVLIGEEMNMSGIDLEVLRYASLLHDIGKIGIKEEILKKDGRLTEKEYRHIQKHVYYTHEILKNVHFERNLRMVPEIAASHHEKVDGTGYHRGLKGDEIPMSGRILALSDVFDAITSRRHYRNRMSFERVISIMLKDVNTHFDNDVVAGFQQVRLAAIGHVLLMERSAEYDEGGLILLKKLDKHITIGEYFNALKKEQLTRGEADIHRIFNLMYHRTEVTQGE